jgi:hypothetical protein
MNITRTTSGIQRAAMTMRDGEIVYDYTESFEPKIPAPTWEVEIPGLDSTIEFHCAKEDLLAEIHNHCLSEMAGGVLDELPGELKGMDGEVVNSDFESL